MQKLFGSVNLDRGFTARSSQWQRAPRPRFDPLSSIKNELAKASRLNSLPHPPITFKALSPEHSANANQAGSLFCTVFAMAESPPRSKYPRCELCRIRVQAISVPL